MERNTKVILIFFIAIAVLVAIMYFSTIKTSDNRKVNDVANISNGFFDARGNGSIKIIEFSDFQCPVCKLNEPIIKEVIEKYGNDISFYYRNFPLPSHKNSFLASLAASCVNEQDKFWEYHDLLFKNQGNFDKESLKNYALQLGLNEEQFNSCLNEEKYKNEVEQDFNEGKKAGVKGTPTFFINNKRYEGFQSLESLKGIIEENA